MIILILGKNGNCHSLAWKLNKSPNVEKIYVQSRNAGTTMLKIPSFQDRNFYRAPQNKIQILTGIDETNPEDILGLAKNLNIDLVVPADSSYFLSDDIQEKLREAKIAYFGPGREAAMIETSRSFAKDLMLKHGIPTPRGGICSTYEEAFHFCFTHLDEEARLIDGSRIAIKGDGQDALFPQTQQEAIQMFGQFWRFPSSSESGEKNQVVYEELVRGNEISVLSFSDGRKDYVRLPYAQSQKGAYEGDLGAKTKGMGCIAPVSFDSVIEENIEKIIEKTLLALKLQKRPFVGMLQINIIITEEGSQVLGFKANFGETEAQALLPLLTCDSHLEEIMTACVEGRLIEPRENSSIEIAIEKDRKSAVIVLAAPGFPQEFQTNLPIHVNRWNQSTDHLPGEHYSFYLDAVSTSEPRQERPTMASAGGRIMAVSAQANTIEEALAHAYGIAKQIEFGDDMNHNRPYYRKDIGTQ